MAKTKKMKVAYSNRCDGSSCSVRPKIQMEGKWLEELGFSIGTYLVVEYEEGSIRIRPFTEDEELLRQQKELLAATAREQKKHRMMLRALSPKMEELSKVADVSSNYGTHPAPIINIMD